MHLTRGEKLAIWCLLPLLIGLLPPVTGWAAAITARPLGLPFLIFWNGLMIAAAPLLIAAAWRLQQHGDRQ